MRVRYANLTPDQARTTRFPIADLVAAMGKVPENPLYLTLLTPEQTGPSPVSKWQKGFARLRGAQAVAAIAPAGAPAGGAGPSDAAMATMAAVADDPNLSKKL